MTVYELLLSSPPGCASERLVRWYASYSPDPSLLFLVLPSLGTKLYNDHFIFHSTVPFPIPVQNLDDTSQHSQVIHILKNCVDHESSIFGVRPYLNNTLPR